ncbi:MAG: fibronectin type III domain-containing protein [Vicinamibacterales bacterium]
MPWQAGLVRALVVALVLIAPGLATPARAAALALAWTDNASDEDGYLVERRDAPAGAFQQIAALGANAVAYLDTAALAGASYCYRVRAFNVAGASAYTNEACGTAAGTASPLSVTLNKASFRANETMVATVNAVGGVVPTAVDAYVVVQAGGVLLSLQLDGRLVPGLVPIARGLVLPTVSAPFAFPLAGAPTGAYTWLAGVTQPGTLTLVAPLASAAFTVTP